MVLPKINFSAEIGDRKRHLESVIRDFKKDLSPEDKEYLDNKVKDCGSQDQNLDTLFPSQKEKFWEIYFSIGQVPENYPLLLSVHVEVA